MTQRAEQLLTVDGFIKMPEYDERYELLDGKMVKKPVPKFSNTRMQGRLLSAISQFDPEEKLGVAVAEVSVTIHPHYASEPDVSFWVVGRVPDFDAEIADRPDLAIEIQSDKQSLGSLTNKAREYLKAGVQLVWIIQPSKRIALVYHQGSNTPITIPPTGALSGENVIPGFEFELAKMFG
jgi:Uma2 family endonuclease